MNDHENRRFAEGVFIDAGSFLKGALAIAREGAEDTDRLLESSMENQGRFGSIVDFLESYQKALEQGIDRRSA